MPVSVFDLFKIGIGPSSSHTVGPMVAARRFALGLEASGLLAATAGVRAELFGSLGATGRGHGSDRAVILGLLGETPDGLDVAEAPGLVARVREAGRLPLLGRHEIAFREGEHLAFLRRALPFHPNGLRLTALGQGGPLRAQVFYSVGGGFVVDEAEAAAGGPAPRDAVRQAHPFRTGAELLARCDEAGLSVAGLMLENERAWRGEAEVRARLLQLWEVMRACVARGCRTEGTLPGGLKVRRRAAPLARALAAAPPGDPLAAMDRVNLWALAVNEENAAGGRVVTAPTNGAAGIVPAVLHHYRLDVPGASDEGVVRFLLAAAAVGIVYKENASISGAEVGCQGEVGVACSMAAAGLADALGGTPAQVENAAEIGMEHHLGLTCDPVGGLVQIPCIERNAMAAVAAITAARMALRGDGRHFVSLDRVVKTMRETGADMKTKYKETARGGLALNVVAGPVDAGEAPPAIGVHLPEC
ncbi:MAG: L-serine ammonia-lyase [Anaeromyxobacteraceae bacterium]|nr:L-serine ammonia-lyase [Anaeromyxobacteraceae bacterium]